ncbi:MAG: hypothetical protein R3F28_13080 [Candidatus Kapaibacterium sp.]
MASPIGRITILAAWLLLTSLPLQSQRGRPLQPEFTGSPVPAGPNVNEFTGDFTYGLPVMTVPEIIRKQLHDLAILSSRSKPER